MNIYVGNLSNQATDDGLKTLFSEFGEVTSARVIRDRFSNEPRGFGFVEMSDKQSSINAIEALNGADYQGKALTVNEARPKEDNRGGRGNGGGYRGGNGGGGYRGDRDGGRRNNW
jgi:RNA recognition motif-containing protein